MNGLPNYDAWKCDPDYGRSHRELEEADRRADLEVSWQCAHGIHHHCRPSVLHKHYYRNEQDEMCFEWRWRKEYGTALNCGCQCHEVDFCNTCQSYQCRCDERYEARYGR